MKSAKKFFRRYIYSTAGILALFFVINLLLVASYFLIASLNEVADSYFPLEKFSQQISCQKDVVSVTTEAQETLHRFGAWAMFMDDKGTVLWEDGLPEHLPRQYTVADVAMFTRWYLEDYPVSVWNDGTGLLVVGFPPGDVFKHNMSFRTAYVWPLMIGMGIALLINVFLMLYLFWRNAHRVEKAMLPILDGIQALSQGTEIHLNEQGELAEINAGLNRAGEALIQKDNTRVDWIRGISHDVRTPLAVILGYASDMEEDKSLPIASRKQAVVIRKQGEKLRSLIADLNLSTKLEYGVLPLRQERIDPLELGRQVVSEYLNNGLSAHYDLRLESKVGKTTEPLYGDSTLLQRMLYNLIQNSMTHNLDGCEIELIVEEIKDGWQFSVSDSGCGMNEWYIQKLNTDENISSSQPGEEHGLGLKIVRQIVKAHRGSILFSNRQTGGVIVQIKLPIQSELHRPDFHIQ